MAPAVEPIVITAWPLFTVRDVDGTPLEGGKLFTYAAGTLMPKASYSDAFLLVSNPNPVVLSADGQALVYLNGTYRLVLTDAEGSQLWEVDNYAWETGIPTPTAGLVSGMTEVTGVTPTTGTGVIQVPGLVPAGYRCEGILIRVDTEFGTSTGLTGLSVGDSTATDRWGLAGLTVGTQTTQQSFRDASRPIAATSYVCLISAIDGTFDTSGSLTCRGFWSSMTNWS
jgi:hypothetical protein